MFIFATGLGRTKLKPDLNVPCENSDAVIKLGGLNVRSMARKVDILLDITPTNRTGVLVLDEI